MANFKVYGGTLHLSDGQYRAIVATTSQKNRPWRIPAGGAVGGISDRR